MLMLVLYYAEQKLCFLADFVSGKKKVWEVKAADLTISPVHRAAIGEVDPNKVEFIFFP
jgi:hypothetical protein